MFSQSRVNEAFFPALQFFMYFFLIDLNSISPQFALLPEDMFVKTLLYCNKIFDESDNHKILETLIRYIIDSKRFSAFYTICMP